MMTRPIHISYLILLLASWSFLTNALRYQDTVRIPYPSSDEDLVFDDIINEISDATASRIKFKAGDDLSRSQTRLEGSGAADQDDTEIDGSGFDGRVSAFNVKPTAPPADGASRYRIKIPLPSIKFDAATLGDMFSTESQNLAIELDDRISSLFQDVQGNQTAIAERFEKSGDGTLATVHLTSWGNENQKSITDRIKTELDTGKLGRLNASTEGFVVQPIKENPNLTMGMRCKPADFWCRDGGCVALEKHCDGNADCTDKSDELGCEPKLIAVLVHPEVQSITEGQRATFFCGSGNLRHQVTWTKKGGSLPANVKVNRGQLQIQNSSVDDAGEYECTAVRSLPGSSATVTLNVASKSGTASAADPEVALSVAQVYAFEGQDAEIACDVEGESSATWTRIDGELPANSNITGGKLLITDVQFADAGLYECRPVGAEAADGAQSVAQVVVIPDPRATGSLHLQKKVYPKITTGNVTVTEGEAVFMRCESTRKGVEVEWLRDALPFSKDVVISGENITIPVSKLVDTGKYHCRHKGKKLEQVSTYLTVLPAPTTTTTTTTTTPTTTSTTEASKQSLDFNATDIYITVRTGEDSQVVWVDEGSNYVIRCVAPGGGLVEWTALDGQILNEDGNGLLRINRASASTTGLFRCHWQSDHTSSVAVDVRLSSSRKDGGWSELQVFVTPRIYIARRDESPFFECNAPVDAGEVRWARIGREMPPTARVSGTRLTFSSVREVDQGVYYCFVSGNLQGNFNGGQLIIASGHRHDHGGTWDEREGSVTIRIGDSGRTVYIERDRSISLTCHAGSNQEVEWLRADGIPLPPSARVEGETLTISSVDVKSSGQYICRARQTGGGQQTFVELITYPAGWKGGRFTGVQIHPDRVVVDEDDEIVLDCQPSDYSAMIEWSRAGFELPTEATVNDKRLTIRRAIPAHSGFYICRVIGEASGSQNIAQVSVRSKRSTDVPEITGGDTGLIRVHIVRVPAETDNLFHEERKPLRLTCLSPDGAPVRWERQGGQPLPSAARVYGLELLFDNPTPEASGTYVCLLERFPTTMAYVVLTIVGHEQPERPHEPWAPSENIHTHSSVVVTPANIRVDLGSQVILECHAQGNSRIIWSKADGSLPAGVSPYENQLILTNVQLGDTGQYICTAIDSPPPNQGSSQIIVTGGRDDYPRQPEAEDSRRTEHDVTLYVYPGPEVRQKEGDTTVLDCLSSDASVLVEWRRISSPRRRSKRQDSETGTGRLIIENARPSDSGVYQCRIKNRRPDQPDVVQTVKLIVGDVDDSDFVIHQEEPSSWTTPRTPPPEPAYPPVWPPYDRPTQAPYYPPIPATPRPFIQRCGPNEATCMSGQCIPRSGICNGKVDCNDGSDEKECDKCDPTEMKCGNGKCVQKIWACDGENDCGDNSDEQDCPTAAPGSQCAVNQFLCESGDQCYPRNFQCDGTVDCVDSSDEIGCAGPTISKPPVETQEVKLGETVTVTCEAVGFPTPLISWRLNWGNVPPPPRVTATSVDGVGVLTIRNFQESDQGAYSCEAVNNMNAVIATPDSFITLEGTVSDICRPPMFNAAARNPSECIQCFCSGITQDCRSCSLYLSDITSSSPPTLVSRDGTPVSAGSVRFDSASGEATIERVNEILQLHNPSWQLPQEFVGDQVSSYGSNLTYSAKYGPRGGRPTLSPDVVIGSDNVALYYRAPQTAPQANVYTDYSVPLLENAWSKRPDSRPGSITPTDIVTRDDMMKVLQSLEYIRVKALYDTLAEYSSIRNIKLGTAVSQDVGRGRATLVEQCICPPGYEGLSCERCTAGYQREATRDGVSARCVQPQRQPERPVEPPAPEPEPVPSGDCDPVGSAYPYPDPRTGQCTCKENTVGPRCDQCRAGSFFLNPDSPGGCELCFCSGVTQNCRSAPWYRDAVRVEARNALEEGLTFTTADRSATYTDHLGYSARDDLVIFERPITDPNDVLYWQLPRSIAGNRITSYGGRLNIKMRAEEDRVPGQRDSIHIRIFGNGITLNHNSTQQLLPGRILEVSAPFRENLWSREDGQFTTKEHLLMALSDLEYILVLMPSSFAVAGDRSAGIGSISIDIAQPRFNGQPLAFAVELCSCPPGYKGSSCEDCDQGYTRSEGGLYLGVCEACRCNGHSEDCDPESGICRNCRDGATGNHCEVFDGPARPFVPPIRPEIQVVIEPRYIDANAGDYVVLNCNVRGQGRPRAVWTRLDRRPLPASATVAADNSLTFRRIDQNDAAVYVCTARSGSRPDVVGSADVRIDVRDGRPAVRPTAAPMRPVDQSLMVYVAPPKSQTVRVGATVQFHCIVRSPSTYTAAWTKIGGKLPSRDSDVAGVLTIANAQPRDSGSYVCTGSNIYRTATDGARLVVEGEPTMPETRPEPPVPSRPRPEARPDWQVGKDEAPSDVRIEPYFLRVREGEPVEFRCLSSGFPAPQRTWNGPQGTIRPPASVDVDGVLRIPAARADEHEGEWVCTATNPAGSQTARTVLYVTREQGVPEVRVDAAEVQARPGEPVQLRCSSSGEPAPSITWTKSDGSLPGSAIQQGGILSIDSVTEADQGTYICIGTSPQGSRQAEVRLLVYPGDRAPLPIAPRPEPERPSQPVYPVENERPAGTAPSAVIEQQSVTAYEGETVHITCRTAGSPQPAVRWYRHGGDPDERHKFNDTIYTISGVRSGDRGVYICAAESSVGLAQASAILEVEGKEEPRTELYPSATQSVQLGEGTFFQCQVVAGVPPPNITWTRTDGKPLTQKTNIADRPDVISFSEVSADETGAYTCTAQNKHGTASATANLQVQGAARVLITPSGPIRRTAGDDVEVECTAEDQPNARVTWRRSSTGAVVVGPESGMLLLRLPNAQESESDNYICEVDSTSFNVDVRIEPSRRPFDSSALIPTRVPFPDDAVIRVEPDRQTVRPGENARLVCVDPEAGLKQIEYIWEREDGQPLPRNAIRNGNYLDFESIRPEEGGRYVCIARTDVSADRAAGEINVHTEPSQLITATESPSEQTVPPAREDVVDRSKDTVLRGQQAVIECEGLNLSPDSEVTWAKREGTMPKQHHIEGTRLVIDNVSEKDSGNYICTYDGRDSTTILVVADVVPRFRGRRDSYAVLPSNLHKTAYFELDMDIRFKPESANGLILYNGYNRNSAQGSSAPADFIALGMNTGHVEFRFDVGGGPGIMLSPRPLELNKWHHARIWRSKREATLTVDDDEPVTGTAPGTMVGLELVGDLHVGGVPDFSAINRRVGFSENFAGCVGLIKAGNMHYDVFLNATEKQGVEDCNTCAQENPCQNNGICQNALTPWGYQCQCPRGFTGTNCETAGFRCINGICGEGRCVDTESSFLCLCPFGKTGKTCQEDVQIDVPSFNKRSYAAYATPRNVLSRLNMDLVFKARSSDDGIILYAGAGENGLEDFFSLAIKDRSLELRFDTGSGYAVLRSMVELRLDTWYRIRVDRTNQAAEMRINDEETVTGNSPGSLTGLNLRTNLYLGGVSDKVRIAQGVQVQNGFDGCVSNLEINGVNYKLGDRASVLESAGVSNCEDSSVCARQPCRRGVCVEEGQGQYRCECPEGYTGANCEVEDNICTKLQPCLNGGTCVGNGTAYRCDCAIGYTGVNCDIAVNVESDVGFTGNGFFEFPGTLLPHAGAKEADFVALSFKTTPGASGDGLLLWQGQRTPAGGSGDYLSLALENGRLVFRYELGSGPAVIRSDENVNDGEWHNVKISRTVKRGELTVDDRAYNGESRGSLTKLDTTGNIFIGGAPNIATTTGHRHNAGFSGCIRDVQISTSGVPKLREQALNGQNVGSCSAEEVS